MARQSGAGLRAPLGGFGFRLLLRRILANNEEQYRHDDQCKYEIVKSHNLFLSLVGQK